MKLSQDCRDAIMLGNRAATVKERVRTLNFYKIRDLHCYLVRFSARSLTVAALTASGQSVF